jgi:uncharacterized protein YgiM (DUF1202 family)
MLLSALLVAPIGLAAIAPASAAPAKTCNGFTHYVLEDNTNVRSGPGTGYKVLRKLNSDTPGGDAQVVTVVKTSNGWSNLLLTPEADFTGPRDGGWVKSSLLAQIPGCKTGFTQQDLKNYLDYCRGKWAIARSDDGVVNVRSGPGTGYGVVAKLDAPPYGEDADIVRLSEYNSKGEFVVTKKNGWTKIAYGIVERESDHALVRRSGGWVKSSLLQSANFCTK